VIIWSAGDRARAAAKNEGARVTVTRDTDEQVDLWDEELFRDGPPFAVFDRLRSQSPLHWSEHEEDPDGGFWSLTRHDDIRMVSRDSESFTNAVGFSVPRRGGTEIGVFADNIMYRDPPDHTAHRKPLNRAFTPKAMSAIEEQVRGVVVSVLDGLEGRSDFDWVPEVAAQIPARVVASVIGVPEADHANIVEWASSIFGNDGSAESMARFGVAVQGIMSYAGTLISTRRAQPSEDIMTLLLSAQVDDEPLTDGVLQMWFLTLAQAGFETTHTLIAQGMAVLDALPDLQARLTADPGAVEPAVEEMLRYISPVNLMARTATRDVEMHGRTIRPGQYVCMWYVAANRDPEVFADAHRFDLDRRPNPHQAFGATGSPHYCLGAHLARLEMRVLLEELVARGFPYRVDGPSERMSSVFMNALVHLPVAAR
jgi:cholest-4-en-3-one 26-monooxygenase